MHINRYGRTTDKEMKYKKSIYERKYSISKNGYSYGSKILKKYGSKTSTNEMKCKSNYLSRVPRPTKVRINPLKYSSNSLLNNSSRSPPSQQDYVKLPRSHKSHLKRPSTSAEHEMELPNSHNSHSKRVFTRQKNIFAQSSERNSSVKRLSTRQKNMFTVQSSEKNSSGKRLSTRNKNIFTQSSEQNSSGKRLSAAIKKRTFGSPSHFVGKHVQSRPNIWSEMIARNISDKELLFLADIYAPVLLQKYMNVMSSPPQSSGHEYESGDGFSAQSIPYKTMQISDISSIKSRVQKVDVGRSILNEVKQNSKHDTIINEPNNMAYKDDLTTSILCDRICNFKIPKMIEFLSGKSYRNRLETIESIINNCSCYKAKRKTEKNIEQQISKTITKSNFERKTKWKSDTLSITLKFNDINSENIKNYFRNNRHRKIGKNFFVSD